MFRAETRLLTERAHIGALFDQFRREAHEIVGIVEVIREFYPDPTDETGKFGMVDVKAVKPFPTPVTLAQVKATPALSAMSLVTSMRLSVQPVTAAEWKKICVLGKVQS